MNFANGTAKVFKVQDQQSRFQAILNTKDKAKCQELNARLPLPKNDEEIEKFKKLFAVVIGGEYEMYWVDMTDNTTSGEKQDWKDAEDKDVYMQNPFIISKVGSVLSLFVMNNKA